MWLNCSVWMFPSFIQSYLRPLVLRERFVPSNQHDLCWRRGAAAGHVETGKRWPAHLLWRRLEKRLYDLFPPRALQVFTLSIEDCCTQKKSVEFLTNDFILSCKCFVHKLGLLKTETLLKVFLLEFNFLLKSSKTNKKKSSISAVMTAGWISNLNTSLMTLWFLL